MREKSSLRWATATLVVAGVASVAGPAAADDRQCLGWDRPVVLEGFVIDGIFPGPPEFESVEGGDARLDARLLYLTEPVCVSGPDAMDAEPVAATELVQLACGERPLPEGEIVRLAGTLFSAHTGYHRTPAMLQCSD